jgi:hypothetical protein
MNECGLNMNMEKMMTMWISRNLDANIYTKFIYAIIKTDLFTLEVKL